ncbi:PAX-interacting protein 1-like isoform X2 [Xenia sp. Carnegie-2017]|uniref:PAX-interacting protein 1-like isoform X2 n=1 Tax=Xenia sp. Carnegie-2017 TaxID=2897299 RepID=UPI001F04A8C9|nr:PAX-interacting protein 1-like isoform X2 [Xenia sp. Carnegie-2017]
MATESLIKIPKSLFKNVKFYLAQEDDSKVKNFLKNGGATREFFFSDSVSHVISNTATFDDAQKAKEFNIPVVKPEWVFFSIISEAVLPLTPFTLEKKLFSSCVACSSQLSRKDREGLWALFSFYGGKWQTNLDSTCTHLIISEAQGEMFENALKLQSVKIVTPEWIVDSVREGGIQNENKYTLTFHEPSMLMTPESPDLANLKKSTIKGGNDESKMKNTQNDNESSSFSRPIRQSAENARQSLRDMVDDMEKSNDEKMSEDSVTDDEEKIDEGNVESTSEETKAVTSSVSKKDIYVTKILSECVFYLEEYKCSVSEESLTMWKEIITQNSGIVSDVYCDKVTYFLCPHHHGLYYKQALSEGKRIVTCHWLNDVIQGQKLIRPKYPIHLPVPFKDKVQRCRSMIISLTGFQGIEREKLKDMVDLVGAKYCGYLSRSVTHLICKTDKSLKYERAKDWGIICTNAAWLCDIVAGGCDYPVNLNRYKIISEENCELSINLNLARELMNAWEGFEEKSAILDKKRKLHMLERQIKKFSQNNKRFCDESTNPSKNARVKEPPRVVFTGLNPTSVRRMTDKLVELGGDTSTSTRTCTHIVATKIMRTIKFLTGISVCQYIVNPQWIEASHYQGEFVDEKDFILKDDNGERLYGMSLSQSIDRAQAKPLFQDITVYVTANVRPDHRNMMEILDCAGGRIMTELPKKTEWKSLAEKKTKDGYPAFVCVTCDEDTHLCREMKMAGIGIHNVEFVLSGILKQELDFHSFNF